MNEQKAKLNLCFYYIKPASLVFQGSTLLLPEDATPDFLVDPPEALTLFNSWTCQITYSDDEITMKTADTICFPLGGEDLLYL